MTFHPPSPIRFQSPKSGHVYILQAASAIAASPELLDDIRRICNQNDVYKLFEKNWGGRPYTSDDARFYFSWAHEGWAKGTHFDFFVSDEEGSIAAALGIKSPNRESAEIGYWCDADHRGITGAAVEHMMAWAASQGFRQLFAKPINERSLSLLKNRGFTRTDPTDAGFGLWIRKL